jgi:hypothetical protein
MSMDFFDAVRANLLTPAVLFFVLGVVATLVRSGLKFPEPIYIALTIYLLCAIGFKGGVAISEGGIATVWLPTLAAVALGALIPLWTYPILRFVGRLSPVDAAAVAGHYGSVSAVTFIAASSFLKQINVEYEGYATAFLAVMESPAIVVAILIGKLASYKKGAAMAAVKLAAREAILGRSVVLLVGTLIVGFLCGRRGAELTEGFFVTPFQGALALFLLELGTVAGRRLSDLREVGIFLLGFGIVMPLVHGVIGVVVGHQVGLRLGGATLLGVLAASASYIAAPAAMRLSLPEANPTYYLTASLAVTFPLNITVGIPIYYGFARWWFGGGL